MSRMDPTLVRGEPANPAFAPHYDGFPLARERDPAATAACGITQATFARPTNTSLADAIKRNKVDDQTTYAGRTRCPSAGGPSSALPPRTHQLFGARMLEQDDGWDLRRPFRRGCRPFAILLRSHPSGHQTG